MRIEVEEAAARWYKEEMGLTGGESLRVFVRLGGCGSVHSGLSLGITQDIPRKPAISQRCEGILFFMEEDNVWYLDNNDLHLYYHASMEEAVIEVRAAKS
ncbi:HesB/YadR/YfhF family protein [Paenibacillus sp. HB172176]|uniref:HesB/YadR/YfhF family protein n=1 Tax=Paenibacillus sp. HB172176 TaxID=2493690 RepID=UPI00143909A1|nr:HesB/YadR/YfhF family protein [Paenibacillus sp. HB172176]